MPFSLIPHRVLDCYTQVTPQMLGSLGIQLLLCDLDYTLAPKSVPRPDETLRAWLADCQTVGITVMILSNNRSSRRVETFCRDLGISYVGHAGKPRVRGYRVLWSRPAFRQSTPPCWGTSSSPTCWEPEEAVFWP